MKLPVTPAPNNRTSKHAERVFLGQPDNPFHLKNWLTVCLNFIEITRHFMLGCCGPFDRLRIDGRVRTDNGASPSSHRAVTVEYALLNFFLILPALHG